MSRSAVAFMLGVIVTLVSAQAYASQCPKLVAQIENATANRFDPTAANAKLKAKDAAALHAAGKHAESEKMAKEALDSLGIK